MHLLNAKEQAIETNSTLLQFPTYFVDVIAYDPIDPWKP
jgi:hypothetical protein